MTRTRKLWNGLAAIGSVLAAIATIVSIVRVTRRRASARALAASEADAAIGDFGVIAGV